MKPVKNRFPNRETVHVPRFVFQVWDTRDPFDEIQAKMNLVNEDNCAIKHVGDLKMPADSVSHLPDIKEVNINPVFPNRTALLHLHNMALSRAFFFSYILQSRYEKKKSNLQTFNKFCGIMKGFGVRKLFYQDKNVFG